MISFKNMGKIYVFLYQNLNDNLFDLMVAMTANLCISILEFKQNSDKEISHDYCRFMYFYIRI